MVLVKHYPKTSAIARRGLVAHQRATRDRKERGAADNPLEKLDTSSVYKVSCIAIAEHILIDI
jgi:hypothetical protein